ncbi:MAG: GNAT family N-acetyltransferase [Anaerolineae bacterium]|nr:GNAT family N-acetyltransferase [Anaerolineae bacterium]
MVKIRRASAFDAAAIAALISVVWDDVQPNVEQCRVVITGEQEWVWLAVEGEAVLGLVACFLSRAGAAWRWEIELLAVHPAVRGRGIGAGLVAASHETGRLLNASFARGLVRVDNAAAQRAFAKNGYETSGRVYQLHAWAPQPTTEPPNGHPLITLTRADTLTYRGLWLEGLDNDRLSDDQRLASLAGGRAQAAAEGRASLTALVAEDNMLPVAFFEGAELLGRYQWWRRML